MEFQVESKKLNHHKIIAKFYIFTTKFLAELQPLQN